METTSKLHPGERFTPVTFKQLDGSDCTFGVAGAWQALFVVNPRGMLQLVQRANAAFLRPDLDRLIGGLRFVIDKNYPIRGTCR